MSTRLRAIRALRWGNYKWRGVWAWLKGRQRCRACRSGWPRRGYHRILSEPERVIAEQSALAEGVMG